MMAGLGWTGLSLVGLMTMSVVLAGRYDACSEGCCPNEYCTENDICYPRASCRYGCPDGTCGQDGYCDPFPLCQLNIECRMGHACSMNYNLGYRTCQYNLNIGSSLCRDRRKRSHWVDHVMAEDEEK